MSKRKSSKKVKQMMVDSVKHEFFCVAIDAWWTSRGVVMEYIDGGYGEFTFGFKASLTANQLRGEL